jgi:protein-tyrosine phosphatase
MQQILPHDLWVGHAGEAADFGPLFEAGIRAVVELAAGEAPSRTPRELIYCRFPLVDNAGNDRKLLDLAVTTLANLIERQVPTLVACSGGSSRAPVLAAAALSLVYQEEPDDCLKQIHEYRPCDVSPALWDEVKKFLASLRL